LHTVWLKEKEIHVTLNHWTGGGTVRSDAQIVIVLQRADQAKRCYATLVGAMGRPIEPRATDLLIPGTHGHEPIKELYEKYKVDPGKVQYVECNGGGYLVSSTHNFLRSRIEAIELVQDDHGVNQSKLLHKNQFWIIPDDIFTDSNSL